MPDHKIISHSNDPNFPQNLRIHPSDRRLQSSQHLDPNDFNEASFGSEAQELAIRKYGIAGRVWYFFAFDVACFESISICHFAGKQHI